MFKILSKKFNPLSFIRPILLSFALILGLFSSCTPLITQASPKPLIIGILMPMDHMALREIVAGFKSSLTQEIDHEVIFKVQNAQGDLNMQRSILQQFVRSQVDLVVPIGTAATQMTISTVKTQPIVSLAAAVDERVIEKAGNITGVLDEIGPEKPLELLKALYPKIKKVTLIYSNSEKVFPEVDRAIKHEKVLGIEIQKLMIQNLSELYTISKLIDKDSEAIFILKDHLIVSGIQTLVKEAEKRHLILMSSDEGSVKEGASFALGVKERSIGEEGGKLAAKLLKGMSPKKFPIQKLNHLAVFYNQQSCDKQGIALSTLKNVAKKSSYSMTKAE